MRDDLTWRQLHRVRKKRDEDEPAPSYRYRMMRRVLLSLFLIAIIVGMADVLLQQQYSLGYVNGVNDGLGTGYSTGELQGQMEANVQIMQWEYAHKCEVDTQGYVRLKIVPGTQTGQYEYACVGGSK